MPKEGARSYLRSVVFVLMVVKRCGIKSCGIDLFSLRGCELAYPALHLHLSNGGVEKLKNPIRTMCEALKVRAQLCK